MEASLRLPLDLLQIVREGDRKLRPHRISFYQQPNQERFTMGFPQKDRLRGEIVILFPGVIIYTVFPFFLVVVCSRLTHNTHTFSIATVPIECPTKTHFVGDGLHVSPSAFDRAMISFILSHPKSALKHYDRRGTGTRMATFGIVQYIYSFSVNLERTKKRKDEEFFRQGVVQLWRDF